MFDSAEYQLIDFGDGEKLENFGGVVVRRQTPSALGRKAGDVRWEAADLVFTRQANQNVWAGSIENDWSIQFHDRGFELRTTPTGQLGVFPEQAENWGWIERCPADLTGLKALNLFAYTGGTTMALAKRGAAVTHVDAAKSVVNWARHNAARSGLDSAPIRWIVEDALTFARREIKRGNRYDVVVADPPSFGRGPGGEIWKIQRDLGELVQLVADLTDHSPKMILLTCHTPGFGSNSIRSEVQSCFRTRMPNIESFEMSLQAASGQRLASGNGVRWFSSQIQHRESEGGQV